MSNKELVCDVDIQQQQPVNDIEMMMDQSTMAASMDLVFVDGGGGEQRLERPRSARHSSQRRPVNVAPVDSRASPSLSTTSTIDDSEDAEDEEEFPPVIGDQVPPPRPLHYLQARPTSPPDSHMLKFTTVDQRSRSSSRSPTSTMMASGGGLCLENLTEARQRVLERYDRKQRPPSSVSRRENVDNDARMAAGVDDCGALRRRQQRLEPLTTVNVQTSSTCGVQLQRY